MEDLSDAQVIAVSLRDPQAFGVVFDRHFRVIYGYLARRLSPSDADELAGEVFRVGFERRAAFDTDRASALPWLYGIASNLVLKHRRHAGRSLRAMARLAGRSHPCDEGVSHRSAHLPRRMHDAGHRVPPPARPRLAVSKSIP